MTPRSRAEKVWLDIKTCLTNKEACVDVLTRFYEDGYKAGMLRAAVIADKFANYEQGCEVDRWQVITAEKIARVVRTEAEHREGGENV